MDEIMTSLIPLLRLVAVAFAVVLAAMTIDLFAGLYKAKLRGETRRSELLKRSIYKFTLYEGGLCIAALIDVCIFLCHGFELFGIGTLHGVPVVSFIIAMFLCIVEGLSVREKADNKIHSEISRAEKLAKHILSRDEWIEVLAGAIVKAQESEKELRAQQGASDNNAPQGANKKENK